MTCGVRNISASICWPNPDYDKMDVTSYHPSCDTSRYMRLMSDYASSWWQ